MRKVKNGAIFCWEWPYPCSGYITKEGKLVCNNFKAKETDKYSCHRCCWMCKTPYVGLPNFYNCEDIDKSAKEKMLFFDKFNKERKRIMSKYYAKNNK